MPTQSEMQENITDRIIEGLQNGIVPWKKPWRNDPNCGLPANIVSRRNYSGINPILLDLAAQGNGFTSRYWATYQQWQQLGGQVKKRPDNVKHGHWGTNIVFFRQVKKTHVDAAGDEKITSFPLMRFYTVFNLDQVEGEKLDHLRPSTDNTRNSLISPKLKTRSLPQVQRSNTAATEPSTPDLLGAFPITAAATLFVCRNEFSSILSTSSMQPATAS